MAIVLIVNPAATRASGAARTAAVRALGPHGLQSVHLTRGPGDAGGLAAQALADGAGVVVAMGGDGTASEVAAALAGGPALLAALPMGSTNVFARATGWPRDPRAALRELSSALGNPRQRELTLGRLEAGPHRRTFLVNVGFGLDADTVHLVESRPAMKRRLRHGWFSLATVTSGLRLGIGPPRIVVRADGEPASELVNLMAACGSPYAYLGSRALDLLPGAVFDGRLAWLGLRRARPHEIAAIVAGALRGARHVGHPALAMGWAERGIEAVADRPVALQADGEPLGWHERLVIAPGPSVRVLAPPERVNLRSPVTQVAHSEVDSTEEHRDVLTS